MRVWGVGRLAGVYSNTHALISLSTHIFWQSQGVQGMECRQCPGGLVPLPTPTPTSYPASMGVRRMAGRHGG